MKCANCGKEIRPGSVYCEHCGSEAMIVSDYNVLEDEVLHSLLEDDDAFRKRQAALKKKQEEMDRLRLEEGGGVKSESEPGKNGFFAKIWSDKKSKIALIICALLIILAVAAILFCTSYRYQMLRANSYDKKGDYVRAVTLYEKALDKRRGSVEARVGLGLDYINLGLYDEAEKVLSEALFIDNDSLEVYRALILLYTATNNTDKLNKLEDNASDSVIRKLFDDTVVTAPSASVKGGKYSEDQEVTLKCDKNCTIYYTLDDTTPDKDNGILYEGTIKIGSGETVLKAIAYNDEAKKSAVTTEKYTISYEAPGYPSLSPRGGHYDSPTAVTIKSDIEGAKIYYTWDDTIPTADSDRYYGPIDIPEGNNILSVIVVDKHGMSSDVLRANYEYTP